MQPPKHLPTTQTFTTFIKNSNSQSNDSKDSKIKINLL